MLPGSSGDDGAEQSKTRDDEVSITENMINMKLEKEAVITIQDQTAELEKAGGSSSEPRFSFMKYLKRSDKKESEVDTSNQEVEDTSRTGLPSYSEAMDSMPPDTSNNMVDGATQTNFDTEEVTEDKEETREETANNDEEQEEEKPARFRFFRFTKS